MPKLEIKREKNDLYLIHIPEMEINQEVDELDLFKILGPKNYAMAKIDKVKKIDVDTKRVEKII